jgi:DMSO/TMAO reductase YedYZ molybdopterin-dependent catalytic subunit
LDIRRPLKESVDGDGDEGPQSRRRDSSPQLPPGQYLTDDFPVLSAGPTPRIPLETWQFTVTTELGQTHQWSWAELMGLQADSITTDIHCVTRWSKLDTAWRRVSVDTLLADVETEADYAMAHSYGGC